MTAYTKSKLALKANVGVETIRFYERQGILAEPLRNKSGYRQYSEEDVRRVKFIKRSQKLGFSLKEIKSLLEMRIHSNTLCDDVKKQAEVKIKEIDNKLETLHNMREILSGLVKSCEKRSTTEDCPILKTIEDNSVIEKGK